MLSRRFLEDVQAIQFLKAILTTADPEKADHQMGRAAEILAYLALTEDFVAADTEEADSECKESYRENFAVTSNPNARVVGGRTGAKQDFLAYFADQFSQLAVSTVWRCNQEGK